MDRFLIADNAMSGKPDMCIIHTIEPIAIIRCIDLHQEFAPGAYYQHFSFVNEDGQRELWTLKIHHLFTTEMDGERHPQIVQHLLGRAWRYFQSYLKWLDEEHG